MKVFGIIGLKNAGKTTLTERLVAELSGRGLSVSTIKHTHHNVDLDRAGTDTFRHRDAGAQEVVLASGARFALLREHRSAPEPEVRDLVARMSPVDLVLVEGFKAASHPKIECHRGAMGHPLLAAENDTMCAIASDVAVETDVPVFDLNDVSAIADFVLAHAQVIHRETEQGHDD